MAAVILLATIAATIILSIEIVNNDFERWFDRWLPIAGVAFMTGVGIVLSGLLIERGLKNRRDF